jgi:TonB-linked SusC/RagA family outer membrane protein
MKKKVWDHALGILFLSANKILLKMKLTLCIILFSIFGAKATDLYSQTTKLSLDLKNTSVKEVLGNIETQSEFFFLYSEKIIDVNREVNIEVHESTIEKILDRIFAGTSVNYIVKGRQIVLTTPEANLFETPSASQQQKKVSGKVTDSSGGALPGVSVVVKGTTTGVITDFDGKFTIAKILENSILQFSFVGMKTQEIVVGNKSNINITLSEETVGIEEVVAVGYGVQKKINLTGAIEQVKEKELANKAVANIGQALQGLVPNLNVSIADGNPVTNATYNIRGGTSFSGGSFLTGSPLFLVDGVEMDINRLNSEDIESISVIKDASAAAIYGAKGAYGVILVTTKRGTKEKTPEISYSGSFQLGNPMDGPDLLNSVEYQQAYLNAITLGGGVPTTKDEYTLKMITNHYNNPQTAPAYYMDGSTIVWVANTNSWKELVREWAPIQKHVLSVSGGGNKSTYYASIGIQDQKGIMAVNEDWKKRYNGMIGFSADVTNWFNIDLKAIFTQYVSQIPYSQSGYNENDIFSVIANSAGRDLLMPILTPSDSPVGAIPTDNHVGYLQRTGNQKTLSEDLIMKIASTVKLFKGLNLKADFAYNPQSNYVKSAIPVYSRIEYSWTNPSTALFDHSSLTKNYSRSETFMTNAYLDYSKTIKEKHEISAVAGFNEELYRGNSLDATVKDLVSINIPVLSLSTGVKTINDNELHWANRGAFGRFNYVYDKKYLFEINGRYDGSSKFSKDGRFKFFPSFSAGWRISEEPFMKTTKKVLNNLKLRTSYGSLGNQNVSNYAYISSYGRTAQVAHLFNGVRPLGITPPGLVSSSLTWETATTIDFGLDATLFNKLTLNYDWYSRETKDILSAGEKLPSVLGAAVPMKNSGTMKTNGWEFSVRWNDQLGNGVKYNLTFVLSDYQSKVIKYSGNPQKLISSLYEGQKMGEIWGFETAGIFQSYDEIANSPDQRTKLDGGVWRPGDIRYADLNDDKIISDGSGTVADPGDKKIIGNSTPRFQFGFTTDLSWKNFDFNMFWQGTGKRDYWIKSTYYWGMIAGGIGTKWGYNHSWTPDRTDAFLPAYKNAEKNMLVQSRYLFNAAFARLKNISIGYTMPENLTKKIDVSKLRIFVSGYNLFSITKIPRVLDPEILTSSYPMLHTYTVGLQVTF